MNYYEIHDPQVNSDKETLECIEEIFRNHTKVKN